MLKYSQENLYTNNSPMVEVITWGCKNMKTLHSSIDLDVFPCQTVPHSGLRNSPYPHRIVSVSSSYRWLHWQFGRDRILIGPSVPHIPPKHESPSATRICKFYIYIYSILLSNDQRGPTTPSELTNSPTMVSSSHVIYQTLVYQGWICASKTLGPKNCMLSYAFLTN